MENLFLPFYFSWRHKTECLSDEEFGKLVRALLIFSETGERESGLSELGELAYGFITDVIERSQKKTTQCRNAVNKRWSNIRPTYDVNTPNIRPTYDVNTINRNRNINTNIKEERDYVSKEESSRFADRFARFWSHYPKKVGKGDAEKRFLKLKPSEDLTEQMIRSVEKQKTTEQWRKSNGQYIPNPSTWLNQERWRDEVNDEYAQSEEEADEEYRRAMNAFG